MKKYLSKICISLVVGIFVIPQVAFAVWWNPFTWSWFKQTYTREEINRPILRKNVGGTTLQQDIKTPMVLVKTERKAKPQSNCNEIKKYYTENSIPKLNDAFSLKRLREGEIVTKLKNNESVTLINSSKTSATETDAVFNKYLAYWQKRIVEIEQERKDSIKDTYQKILDGSASNCANDLVVETLPGAYDVKYVQRSTSQVSLTPQSYQYTKDTNLEMQISGLNRNVSDLTQKLNQRPIVQDFEYTLNRVGQFPPRVDIRWDGNFGSAHSSDGNYYQIRCENNMGRTECNTY